MTRDLSHRIGAFLDAHHVLSLATLGPSGPHATNLFYARDGLELVWLSDPDTQHSRNIVAAPQVAATVAPDYSDFAVIRGVQIMGVARRIEAVDDRGRLLALLEARYAFLGELAEVPQKLRDAYARTAVYRLQPSRMVWIDNTQGFGHKETLDLLP